MTPNICADDDLTFWCPSCQLKFSETNKMGMAICPLCGGKRDDGLNQLADNYLQCVKCKCKFPANIFQTGPACPNGCKII